jgi:diaminobutyrate-2-oxoglutarate transaminase
VGAWFQEQLGHALQPLPLVGEVRGLGMMAGVELVDRSAAGAGAAYYDNAAPLAARVMRGCVERGLIPRLRGNVVCLAPPLVSTEAQLSRVVDVLGEAIRAATGS